MSRSGPARRRLKLRFHLRSRSRLARSGQASKVPGQFRIRATPGRWQNIAKGQWRAKYAKQVLPAPGCRAPAARNRGHRSPCPAHPCLQHLSSWSVRFGSPTPVWHHLRSSRPRLNKGMHSIIRERAYANLGRFYPAALYYHTLQWHGIIHIMFLMNNINLPSSLLWLNFR